MKKIITSISCHHRALQVEFKTKVFGLNIIQIVHINVALTEIGELECLKRINTKTSTT